MNIPRLITDSDGNTVWRWDGEAFGNTPPQAEVTGAGQFVFNLRFPGQYYDSESGLNQNNYRDYDPTTGRYVESDPLGFGGGQISTYGYVKGNPLSHIDPWGLANMNLFSPGSSLAQQTDLWNPAGYYSISGHGNPYNVADQNGKLLSPSDLAAMINNDWNYVGQPVYLDSCSTGKGANSFAQKLSNLLGVPVIAPTDDVNTYMRTANGQVVSYTESVANGGSYQTYTPAIPYHFGVNGSGW